MSTTTAIINPLEKNYQRGDAVMITTREGQMLRGTYSHRAPNGKAYIKAEDGKGYEREYKSVRKIGQAETDFNIQQLGPDGQPLPAPPPPPQFDINERFGFLEQLVRMVINKTAVSMIVTGEGGLGKTYTVKREIRRRVLVKGTDYVYIKGFTTPRGLYRCLFENKDKLVIFDDCDDVFVDPTGQNLLKGALDSYDEREIHWITKSSDESLPDNFVFTGQVIFISNRSQDAIPQALLSRSMVVDLTMSREDKLKRMKFIAKGSKEFMPEVPMADKMTALDLIEENLDNVKELSLRSLEKVIKIKLGQNDTFQYEDTEDMVETDWKVLARYMLVN